MNNLRPAARTIRAVLREAQVQAGLIGAALQHHFRRTRHGAGAKPQRLCLVSHDALRHGAQLLTLELARRFACNFGIELHIVLLGDGPLVSAFRRFGPIYRLAGQNSAEAHELAAQLAGSGVRAAICSSVATGLFTATLSRAGIRSVALVHELPQLISARNLEAHARAVADNAASIVFASAFVRDNFLGGAPNSAIVRPQGLSKRRRAPLPRERLNARRFLLRRHGIAPNAPLVLAVGYGDKRKGFDLFGDIAAQAHELDPRIRFMWLGAIAPEMRKIAESPSHQHVIHAAYAADTGPYYAGADVFALASREDPFPSALLEAFDAGLPAIAFAGAGGFEDVLRQARGSIVPAFDTRAFAQAAIEKCLADHAEASESAQIAVAHGYSMQGYALDLASLAEVAPPRISVVVPNFNYERHLRQRLHSILRQTHPIVELIVLDDCSSDGSVAVAHDVLRTADVEWRILENREKAHTVLQQWLKGVQAAKGEYVWIAEADDLSDRRFLETTVQPFADGAIVMSYCQSRQIDQKGRTLDKDYLVYVSDISPTRWRSAYVNDGVQEVVSALSIKNTVPNVSACLFRRDALLRALHDCASEIQRFRIAGDWLTYVRVLRHGRIAFDPRPLNLHRRHAGSVTASALSGEDHVREVAEMQALVAAEFNVDSETRAKAAAYLVKLRHHFKLTS